MGLWGRVNIPKKRKCKTMGKEEIKQLKIVMRPVYLSSEENSERVKRLARFLFPMMFTKGKRA